MNWEEFDEQSRPGGIVLDVPSTMLSTPSIVLGTPSIVLGVLCQI